VQPKSKGACYQIPDLTTITSFLTLRYNHPSVLQQKDTIKRAGISNTIKNPQKLSLLFNSCTAGDFSVRLSRPEGTRKKLFKQEKYVSSMNPQMILILGETASGKGRLALKLAEHLDAEIISIDSMKVYRRMDIGTAKPSKQAREKIKHHLIDILEPSESFNVGMFYNYAQSAVEEIKSRNKTVIAVGGTALYIKALLFGLFEGPGKNQDIRDRLEKKANVKGLKFLHQQLLKIDPEAALNIHPNDRKRIIRALEVYKITKKPISSLQQQWDKEKPLHNWTIIGIKRDKKDVNSLINIRVKNMLEQNLVDEVKSLLSEEEPLSEQARSAIGYAEIIEYLNKKNTLEKTFEMIKINTRRLAKNQRTWFKTFRTVNWIEAEPGEPQQSISQKTIKLLQKISPPQTS